MNRSTLVNPNASSLLYVASQLPKRSETFVYREVLGLRDRGYQVMVASVRSPETNLGTASLDDLANEAIVIYHGRWWLWGLIECLKKPDVGWQILWDALRGADVHGLGKRLKIIAQGLGGLSLARRLRSGRIPVTHVHAHMAHVPTTIAMYTAMALNVSFSFTGHAADLFRDRQLLVTKLRRSAFVCCISYWHRNFYRQAMAEARITDPLPDDRLPVVRCGVPKNVRDDPGDGLSADGDHDLELLTVGRLVPKKGVAPLLRAWAVLHQRDQLQTPGGRWQLVVVGDGPEEQALRNLAETLGITQRVSFLGAQNNDRVQQYMARCELFILNCQPAQDGDRDGIPVVLMESMAAGKCAISGNLPAIRELIDHDKNGILVEADHPEALADTLAGLMTDKNRREQLGQAGKQQVDDEFTLDHNLDRLTHAFAQTTNVR